MSGPAVTERALILRIAPNGESFLRLNVLSSESGGFLCLKRISKKNQQTTAPDLFDTADIHLETSKQGTARFVSDYQLIHRRASMGKSYRTLQHASDYCALIAQNSPHMADPEMLFQLTERTLDAFAEGKAPSIVFLKAIYLLLKDEGYPVRESWWPKLPTTLRAATKQILNNPSPLTAEKALSDNSQQASNSLCRWMRRETDLILPDSLKV